MRRQRRQQCSASRHTPAGVNRLLAEAEAKVAAGEGEALLSQRYYGFVPISAARCLPVVEANAGGTGHVCGSRQRCEQVRVASGARRAASPLCPSPSGSDRRTVHTSGCEQTRRPLLLRLHRRAAGSNAATPAPAPRAPVNHTVSASCLRPQSSATWASQGRGRRRRTTRVRRTLFCRRTSCHVPPLHTRWP